MKVKDKELSSNTQSYLHITVLLLGVVMGLHIERVFLYGILRPDKLNDEYFPTKTYLAH